MSETGLWNLLIAVFAPVVTGVATLLLPGRAVAARVLTALAGPVAAVVALLLLVSEHGMGVGASVPFVREMHIDLALTADPLGTFFALLIAGIGALIVLYARGYFGRDEASLARFYPPLGLFATAMIGIVLSDNFVMLFIFWELTSISSFLLIGWDRDDPRAVRLAMQAFIVTGLGGMALLGGLMLLGVATETWSFTELARIAASGGLLSGPHAGMIPWAFALMFAGGAAKSAQFPLHFWLPGAMAAPTPVSAYLHSATMVKAGVFLFGRLFPVLAVVGLWTPLLVGFGAVTMLYGAYVAVRSQELKKIFAYTTVSQLGLLTCMYGLGTFEHHGEANLIWPVTQILNHALYKAPLFIIAGAIMHIVGRKELHQLRGLIRSHTLLAVICLAGCYALAAGPFTLSFTMKEAFLYQIVHAAEESPVVWVVGVMTVLTAMCNVIIFVRFLTTFLSRVPDHEGREEHDPHAEADNPPEHDAGHDPSAHGHEHERGLWASCIWWPAAFLVAWQFVGGIAPAWFGALVGPVETNHGYWEELPSFFHAITHPSPALAMSGIAIVLGVVVGLTSLGRRVFADPFDRLYPATYRGLEVAGYRLMRMIQTGRIRDYVVAVIITMLVGLGLTMFYTPAWRAWPGVASFLGAGIGFRMAAIFLTLLICATAVLLAIVQSRITRVLVLGSCGFSVTGMYLLYQAPDLALTQLMFEIISVVLFMLVFRLLPEDEKEAPARLQGSWRLVLASVTGLAVGWTVLHAGGVADRENERIIQQQLADAGSQATGAHVLPVAAAPAASEHGHRGAADEAYEPTGRLGDWFLRHSHDGSAGTDGRGGGGNNSVNVILVDFRGYDTLGEITVLSIAMMGVLALLTAAPALTRREGAKGAGATFARVQPVGAQPHLRTVLFRTAMRLILPLSLMFAVYVYFKGHQEPGGGFIAGLIAAVGLAVYRMSEGREALTRLVPFRPGKIAAVGLALALATGGVPLLIGLLAGQGAEPFLTSGQGYIPRPGYFPYHLPSVAFFDLGVFIVVIGVSVGMINRFEEELE